MRHSDAFQKAARAAAWHMATRWVLSVVLLALFFLAWFEAASLGALLGRFVGEFLDAAGLR